MRFAIRFLLLGLCFLSYNVAQAELAVRKNIDALTPSELKAYEHAIQILKDRSDKNPYDKKGFLWQAWIHNCPGLWVPETDTLVTADTEPTCDFWTSQTSKPGFTFENPGMCEHGTDLFLTWHRAEFYYFEQLLKSTDPEGTITDSRDITGPSTANVAVPYWNWTRKPTGQRYPTAFENEQSPLFHTERETSPAPAFPFTSPFLIAYQLYKLDWSDFAGGEHAQGGGFGDFERVAHNPMHGLFIGGDMANPMRAALDPIFFSFHAYIDAIFERRLELHGRDEVTSKGFFLRGSQPDSVSDPVGYEEGKGGPTMGHSEIYLDSKALGYRYEIDDDNTWITEKELDALIVGVDGKPPMFGAGPMSVFSRLIEGGDYTARTEPSIVHSEGITIPQPGAHIPSHATFHRNPNESDLSYQVDVYLYPKTSSFDAANETFRKQYLLTSFVHWGSGTCRDQSAPSYSVPLADELRRMSEGGLGGQQWYLSMAVTVLPEQNTFGRLAIIP